MAVWNFLIKPASGLCNMQCKYCFYADEMEKRECASYGIMSKDTVRAFIEQIFAQRPDECNFVFQGGEPTLAGLDYYEIFAETVEEYNTKKIPISYSLQTNGYAFHEKWAEFLASKRFLVGISLDGYAQLHNRYRVDREGKGTSNRVLWTIKLLEKHHVAYNILTVVTAQTARHTEKIYRYFYRQGFGYQQYIPCLDPLGDVRGQEEYSLTPSSYANFLKNLFDLWYEDVIKGRQPYIRYFENLLAIMLGQIPETCGLLGHCTRQLVIEADGRVYPCDFYVLDEYCIGDIKKDSFTQIEKNREESGFLEASFIKEEECLSCSWYFLCGGGCRRERDFGQVLGRSYYCNAYQEFFEYIYPRLKQVTLLCRQRQSPR